MKLWPAILHLPTEWQAMARLVTARTTAQRRNDDHQVAILDSALIFLAISREGKSRPALLELTSAPDHCEALEEALRYAAASGNTERVRAVHRAIAVSHRMKTGSTSDQSPQYVNPAPRKARFFQIALIAILAIGICSGPLLWRVWDGISPR